MEIDRSGRERLKGKSYVQKLVEIRFINAEELRFPFPLVTRLIYHNIHIRKVFQ